MMKTALLFCLFSISFANAFIFPPRSFLKDSNSKSCSVPPEPYASPDQVKAKVGSTLDKFAETVAELVKNDPGGTVVNLVYKDTVIWSKGFGVRNMSEHGPNNRVDGDSIFRIGSVTKLFTAMMMLMLRDNGSISSLYSDVTTVLPELKIKNPFKQKRGITFDQLSSHMAGLPRETPCPRPLENNGCRLSFDEVWDNLSKMELIYPPGTWPQYSNLGIALLGRALEKVGGDTWENMLDQMILKPLGMASTVNNVDSHMMQKLAVGYSPDGTVAKLVDIGFEAPAGQTYSTTNDLSKLMISIMNNMDSKHSDALLDSETLREWMQPVYMYPDGTGYGRPWELEPHGDYTFRTKGGAIPGYKAWFWMAPEIKTGVVILKSCSNCQSESELSGNAGDLIQHLRNHLEHNTDLLPPARVPPNPQEYVGTYTLIDDPIQQATLRVKIGELNGQMVLLGEVQGVSVRLEWHKELGTDTFQISGRGMSFPCIYLAFGYLDEYVKFIRNQAGNITGLTLEGVFPGYVLIRKN